MNSIGDSLLDERREGHSESYKMPLLVAFFSILMAYFVGETLFGKNSLEVLFALQEKETELQTNIETLKKQNAILQKKYFELKNIMPSEDDE